jgi:nucleotide-binding universal stress UspA family protein
MKTERMNCWEYKKCGREPGGSMTGEMGVCPAASDDSFHNVNRGENAGRICWPVAGTFCGGEVQGSFTEKEKSCAECDFFKCVQQEEEAVNHIAKFLHLEALTGKVRIALVVISLLLIATLHYTIETNHREFHLLHRQLHLVPIILAAYWFGRKGGLTVSIASSILFLPGVLTDYDNSSIYFFNNILEIIIFNIVAYMAGLYGDLRRSQFITASNEQDNEQENEASKGERNLLVCIDDSLNAIKLAKYVVDTFAKQNGMTVTLLGLIREPSEDQFSNHEQCLHARAENEGHIISLVRNAHEMLIAGGFPEEVVTINIVKFQQGSVAAKILQELETGRYDTIVIGGRKMSKSEEFMFGNSAIKLIREAPCSLVTVF